MEKGVDRNICLPFEELEPCCQKEILQQRKEAAFKEKIRMYDRSNKRHRMRDSVFTTIHDNSHCGCCGHVQEYHLLSLLRQEQQSAMNGRDPHHTYGDERDASSCGSDSDDDLDMLDDYISPSEKLRLEQAKTAAITIENHSLLGFGIHIQESATHLLDLVKSSFAPFVIHVCSPDERLCASLDLAMESMARVYLGTAFRRILVSESGPLLHALSVSEIAVPCIICVKRGEVTSSITDIQRFDAGGNVMLISEIEKHLDHDHMLFRENEAVLRLQYDLLNDDTELELSGELETQPEEGSYCDEPGCDRKFPHTHIGSGDAAGASKSVAGSSLVGITDSNGADVFEKNYLLKL